MFHSIQCMDAYFLGVSCKSHPTTRTSACGKVMYSKPKLLLSSQLCTYVPVVCHEHHCKLITLQLSLHPANHFHILHIQCVHTAAGANCAIYTHTPSVMACLVCLGTSSEAIQVVVCFCCTGPNAKHRNTHKRTAYTSY